MISQFLYWQSPENGRLKGTIVCQDGHVHLTDIPPDDTERYEALIRDFANGCDRLPFTTAQAEAFLTSRGLPKVDLNPPLIFFGPLDSTSSAPQKVEAPTPIPTPDTVSTIVLKIVSDDDKE
jgi:hypothetical protein